MTNILLIFTLVSSFGVNTIASNATSPKHKKILKVKSATTAKVAPPCSVTVSLIGTGTYDCPGGGASIFYTAGGSCTKSNSIDCLSAYTSAYNCANDKVSAALSIQRQIAALDCPPE